jgi:hypothetical protein
MTSLKPYRGTTRIEMERAGRALPKKIYTCGMCGEAQSHDGAYQHQMKECSQRPGSTVKRPQ